ncbi:sensor histidine kinase [Parasediminibacterium sp. JCM 36343]|uniref:sensor histidine kinase n=1 Tax=Parasediminibacterium sp. JCM 36343 TaxID=3374279 RepID=UPI00397E831C
MNSLIDFFNKLFETNGFMPRWQCGHWTEAHGWVYILSNINIGLAYLTIPMLMVYFIKKREDTPFRGIFILFSLFIIFCGLTHIVDAGMFWYPLYRLNAVLLFITALISTATVVALYKNLPAAFNLKSPAELQKIIDEQTAALQIANQKLKASEEQFKALVNNNPDVIMLMGKNLEYKFVNESVTSVSSKSITDFIGKKPTDIFSKHPNTPKFTKHLEDVFATGKNAHYEVESVTDKKGAGYFAINMIPLFSKEGEVSDVLAITKDFTEIKQNEQKLNETIERLDKLSKRLEFKKNTLQDFAYIVSHNLRSPVGNLSLLMDIYKRTTIAEKKEELLGKLFQVTTQLSKTVQDLSEVVNINQNMELERQALPFSTVLESQITSLSTQIAASNATITYHFADCETINYPKIYLESIFLNLLTNALKYASENRQPEIVFTSFKNENGLITLTCKDNGMGLDLNKYGNKIFSLHKTFHNRPDSKGVGLFITKHQVKSLGGSIRVESEPDKGATFIINFNEIDFL